MTGIMQNNLLEGHPEGLDKHVKVYRGHLPVDDPTSPHNFTDQVRSFFDEHYRNDELPLWVEYAGQRYTVILGSDLVLNMESRTLDYIQQRTSDDLHYWLKQTYEYLGFDKENFRVLLVGSDE